MKDCFLNLAGKYSRDKELIERLWNEIECAYSSTGRHYHNLAHIENVINHLNEMKSQISDWDAVLFSAFYHDIVYDVINTQNEEDSAALAKERLHDLSYPIEKIDKCISQILATKGHYETDDTDTNIFVDADLSILGADWETYSLYCLRVREEYSAYPDSAYNTGRKKVLNSILAMSNIYKTVHFAKRLEENARINIAKEIESISL